GQKSMSTSKIADIRETLLEYRGDFSKPPFDIWLDRSRLMTEVFERLSGRGLRPEDISLGTTGNAADAMVTFKMPVLNLTCEVFVQGLRLVAFEPDWGRAAQIAETFEQARDAVSNATKTQFKDS